MNARPELPLPAAEIVERLNTRRRIPLTSWSLTVTQVTLVLRDAAPPLVETLVEVSTIHVATTHAATTRAAMTGATEARTTKTETTKTETAGRWAVRFVVRPEVLRAGPQAFVLLLKVKLEDWWLTRNRPDPVRSVCERRPRAERLG
ncbi:hypothetical protein [Kineosporia succinea]|uniref:Uncharacterized protein n=1 Tax=Kineosporia succinea TaxID=84632 RepID=A0ABT9PC68_9ACTN|nr:hypothetical protein [Kineosporia succinea]MDP9829994.1 hypothetical protein [Kineosporia succinea]